jgi:hypothetical protein
VVDLISYVGSQFPSRIVGKFSHVDDGLDARKILHRYVPDVLVQSMSGNGRAIEQPADFVKSCVHSQDVMAPFHQDGYE